MRRYRHALGMITDPGNLRQENQDSLVLRTGSLGRREFLLAAVADGMGGEQFGGWASLTAAAALERWWDEQLPALMRDGADLAAIGDGLAAVTDHINWTIYAETQPRDARSGTTLSLLFLLENRYLLLHVGDSRIYLLGRRPRQLTVDQTWCRQEVDAGRMTPQQAAGHPMRHALVSTLGMAPQFELQREGGQAAAGESILLCTDGFYQEFDPLILPPGAKAPQALLDGARGAVMRGSAGDNLSAIMISLSASWR